MSGLFENRGIKSYLISNQITYTSILITFDVKETFNPLLYTKSIDMCKVIPIKTKICCDVTDLSIYDLTVFQGHKI